MHDRKLIIFFLVTPAVDESFQFLIKTQHQIKI